MSLKAKLAGLAVAAGIAVAGWAPAASAATDPGEVIADRVQHQVIDRVESLGDELGLQIRF
jgi:hypothetical protein